LCLPPNLPLDSQRLYARKKHSPFLEKDSVFVFFRPSVEQLLFLEPLTVVPRVHLLRNNIRFFANTPRKQTRLLEDRRANLLEVVGAKHIPHRRLHKIPQRRLRRQKIARSSHGFDHSVPSSQFRIAQLSALASKTHVILSGELSFASRKTTRSRRTPIASTPPASHQGILTRRS